MSDFRVQDAEVGKPDFAGQTVLEIYGKVSTRFAVYRNAKQVMIQFADDDDEGVNQRSSLTPLASLRSEISAILADLALDPSSYQQAKVSKYTDQLGRALVVAMQGDLPRATSDLEKILVNLTEDRASDTRTWYLLWAAMATFATIILAWIIGSSWFVNAFGIPKIGDGWPKYWNAAAVGALGALFSIALQLRAREVRVDTQPWDNISDAVLRVFVGATSATLLTALFLGQFVEVSLSNTAVRTSSEGLFIIAFAAGFTERLAADFLSSIGLAGKRATPSTTVPAGKAQNERDMTGSTSAPRASSHGSTPPISSGNAAILNAAADPAEDEEHAPDDDELEYDGALASSASPNRPVG